jgi:putative transcriptional regulator
MDKLIQNSFSALHSLHWSKNFLIGPFSINFSLQKRKDALYPLRSGIRNRLTLLRDERGISRQELALALDVRPTTLEAVESETYMPSLDLAFRISSFFSLPVDAVFLYNRNATNYTM